MKHHDFMRRRTANILLSAKANGSRWLSVVACLSAMPACLPDPPNYYGNQAAPQVMPPATMSLEIPTSPLGGEVRGVEVGQVRWFGRIDTTTDPENPYFGWTNAGFAAKFTGTSIGVTLSIGAVADNLCQTAPCGLFFQPVIDGVVRERVKVPSGTSTVTLATDLSPGTHTLEFYRETESPHGTSQFLGITDATLEAPPTYSGRVIEFVADSITAGYGALGDEPHPDYQNPSPCPFTFDTQTGYQTYAAKLARALNADASILALSGWGLYRGLNLGGGEGTNFAVPSEYTSSRYDIPPSPQWDFRVKANAVVINLGTNDRAAGDPGPAFKQALKSLVELIRSKNPGAWIFPVTGTMLDGQARGWIKGYMESFVSEEGGDQARLTYVDLGVQDLLLGTGCHGHPSVREHQRMAEVLYPVLKEKLGW